ncbi:hypothetical protein [Kitasatospora sp. A2-31]|uniref:hypothetical protein n=1 Tax=Kitasatospora sp. A2-31 TaxID=2916414 RepID=UPI001EEA9489|nr:hypothetical protein [Kitasatospora sp. A2-31]MCG6493843.1 hypothetical protein [Kitasatospora sp. A2-31]
MRFLFVHGTGVRREGYDPLFELVARELTKRFPAADVVPCYWGDDHGVTLAAGGASIPGFAGLPTPPADPAGVPAEALVDRVDGGWTLLLVDPLCELRVLAELPAQEDAFGAPGVRTPGEVVAGLLAALSGSPAAGGAAGSGELEELLAATVLAPHLAAALDRLATAEEFAQACDRAVEPAAGAELTAATARALTAELLTLAGPAALCTADERDRLVLLLTDRLGGAARGPLGRAAGVLGRLGMRLGGQRLLERHRGALTVGATPALGDILRYQARGGPLRAYLADRIAAAPGPTVVIGHSLGGIALVDCLALAAARGETPAGLRLLVTVGSQAPFLHELGALHGLEPGAALPSGFPQWLNVYDPGDVLGYRAAPVFPGDPRVTDHEVSSRQPFPYCHGAYFKLPALYDRIAAALDGTDPAAGPRAAGGAAGAAAPPAVPRTRRAGDARAAG